MGIDRKRKTLIIQITLFILSVAGATIAGAEWMFGKSLSPLFSEQLLSTSELMTGFYFSIPYFSRSAKNIILVFPLTDCEYTWNFWEKLGNSGTQHKSILPSKNRNFLWVDMCSLWISMDPFKGIPALVFLYSG